MKIFLRSVSVVLIVVIAYVGFTCVSVWYASGEDQQEKADAIVVLGAAQYAGRPSPVLKARLDHAAALWKKKLAPTIVVTGGKVTGDRNSEAGVSAAYLGRLGVPDSSILREVQGRSTWESLQATTRFLETRDIKTVILVSDPFHNARVSGMAKDLGLEPRVSPTRTSPITGQEQLPYFGKEIVAVGVGRLFGFDRLATLEQDFSAG